MSAPETPRRRSTGTPSRINLSPRFNPLLADESALDDSETPSPSHHRPSPSGGGHTIKRRVWSDAARGRSGSRVSGHRPSFSVGRRLGGADDKPILPNPIEKKGEESTPLPLVPMIVLAISMLSEFLSANVSAPFILFLVESFGVGGPEKDAGKVGLWTGILGASFFLTQFSTSLLWANIAEHYGRRTVFWTSLLGLSAATTAFGTASTLGEAICMRLIQGVFSGAVGVSRGAVKDVTDSTNEGRAYAILGFCWGMGGIVGPIIGGTFEQPIKQHPSWFGEHPPKILITYPYLLPCFVASLVTLLGALLCVFLNRDGGPRWGGIRLEGPEKDLEPGVVRRVSRKISGILPGGARRPSTTTEMTGSPLAERRPSGSAYGYGRRPSRTRRTSGDSPTPLGLEDGERTEQEQEEPKLSFAQRLLFAQEENVMSLTDLWVSSALAEESAAAPEEEGEYGSELAEEDDDIEDRESIAETVTPAPGESSEHLRDPTSTTQSIASSPSRPLPARVLSGERSPLLGPGSARRPSRGTEFRDRLAMLGAIPRVGQGAQLRRGSLAAASRPRSIFSNTGLESPAMAPPSEGGYFGGTPADQGGLAVIQETHGQPQQQPQPQQEQESTPVVSKEKLPYIILFQYGMLALHNTTYDQLFLSLLLTAFPGGGLGLSAPHFAQLIAMMAAVSMINQFVLYPFVGPPRGKLSHLAMFRLGGGIFITSYILTPWLRSLARPDEESDALVMTGMALLTAFRFMGITASYTAMMVLINTASPPALVNTANALGQSVVALSRFVGPILGGVLWSVSISGNLEGFPWGFHIVSLMALFALAHSFLIR